MDGGEINGFVHFEGGSAERRYDLGNTELGSETPPENINQSKRRAHLGWNGLLTSARMRGMLEGSERCTERFRF